MDTIRLEPTTKAFIDSLKGAKPLEKIPINDARKFYDKLQSDQSYRDTVEIEEFWIEIKN